MMFDVHTHNHNPKWDAVVNCNTLADTKKFKRFSIGIHPWDITPDWREELDVIEHSENVRFCTAIGETGIDRANTSSNLNIACQTEVFEEHIRLARQLSKPLIIHCVKAFDIVAGILKKCKFDNPVIFHGFRGKQEMARQLLSSGYYLSFGLRFNELSIIEAYKSRKMFLETDDSGENINSVYKAASKALNISPTDIEVPGIFTS